MMFSELRNNRRCCIRDCAAADRRRDRRYRREHDPMLNSVLNGEWSNSVPGRQIPKGFLSYSLYNIVFIPVFNNNIHY